MATVTETYAQTAERIMGELAERGQYREAVALRELMWALGRAEADTIRLDWLAATFGNTLSGLLPDVPEGGGIRANLAIAMGAGPDLDDE